MVPTSQSSSPSLRFVGSRVQKISILHLCLCYALFEWISRYMRWKTVAFCPNRTSSSTFTSFMWFKYVTQTMFVRKTKENITLLCTTITFFSWVSEALGRAEVAGRNDIASARWINPGQSSLRCYNSNKLLDSTVPFFYVLRFLRSLTCRSL